MSKKRRQIRGKQPPHGSRGRDRGPSSCRDWPQDRPLSNQGATGVPVFAQNPARYAPRDPSETRTEQELASEVHISTAYDQDLLNRAREQWRRGDWTSLQALEAGEMERHPDRARLALLVAAGHHAAGQRNSARLFAQMAAEWGCDRTLIARVLIGGVHNTLARAAIASGRHRERALRHFEQAVAAGAPGGASALAMQGRIEYQLGQMGLEAEVSRLRAACTPIARPPMLASPLAQLSAQLHLQSELLTTALKTQQNDLANVRKALESTVEREVLNATKQLEAFVNLQGYLVNGVLVPEVHGWPISPDFAQLLIHMLTTTAYDLVVEFGSGTSTVLMAACLQRLASADESAPRPVQLAFEHLAQYHQQTTAVLRSWALQDCVRLLHAPLRPYRDMDGQDYPFYDCQASLAELARGLPKLLSQTRILALVDGPPGGTGSHARYPALPVLMQHFSGAQMTLLLDDHMRTDEREIVQMWCERLRKHGSEPQVVEHRLEKGACTLTF